MLRLIMVTAAILTIAGTFAGCKKTEVQGSTEPGIPMGPSTSLEDAQPPPPPPRAEAPRRLEDLATDAEREKEPEVRPPTGAEGQRILYTVQKGDTLWSIAKRFLGNGKRWPEIVAANPGLVPEKLSVGRQIVIPPK